MAAGQHDGFVIQVMPFEFLDYLLGEFGQERHVVFRINDERAARPARKLVEVNHRADGSPNIAQVLEVNGGFQAFADVAGPDYVGEISRGVIEGSYLNPRVVRGGDKRIARSQARAYDAQAVTALRFQPVEAAAYVDHSLADGVESASDVGGDGIVGAVDFGGAANVVIGHGQTQDRDAHPVQRPAQCVVRNRIGIPVG